MREVLPTKDESIDKNAKRIEDSLMAYNSFVISLIISTFATILVYSQEPSSLGNVIIGCYVVVMAVMLWFLGSEHSAGIIWAMWTVLVYPFIWYLVSLALPPDVGVGVILGLIIHSLVRFVLHLIVKWKMSFILMIPVLFVVAFYGLQYPPTEKFVVVLNGFLTAYTMLHIITWVTYHHVYEYSKSIELKRLMTLYI